MCNLRFPKYYLIMQAFDKHEWNHFITRDSINDKQRSERCTHRRELVKQNNSSEHIVNNLADSLDQLRE